MVAGVDPVAEIAASYQDEFGIPCATDLDGMLAQKDVEAVIVSTPHSLHAPLGIEAAKAGKPQGRPSKRRQDGEARVGHAELGSKTHGLDVVFDRGVR